MTHQVESGQAGAENQDEIEIMPQMIEAGALRLAEIGEASAAYLAEEAYRAMRAEFYRATVSARQYVDEFRPCSERASDTRGQIAERPPR